ncbi:MAG: sensor histidine kinase, partial [Dehalococcoidia bacterium]|nr:sensor histidine kinase [Dehalococcoidia bacterium]
RKKSPVFRRALERLQQMAMAGKLASAATISRLGEHDGLAVIDDTGQIQYISGIAENLYRKLGHTGSLLSNHLADLQTDEQIVADCFAQGVCLEREVRQDSLVWIKKTIPILADDWLTLPGRDGRAACSHVLLVIQDVTEQRQREQALLVKNAMIQEIHHRVKNNLQTIAALLRLQARRSANPEVADLLQASVNRVLSVAVVHEFLSHDEDATINIRDVTARIISEVHGILDPEKDIRIVLQGDNVLLPAQQATSTALVINELLQNSVKHGYVDRDRGVVVVALREQDGRITIEIADDGVGLQQPLPTESDAHLGLTIVRTLVREDLRGEFSLTSDRGVTARVTFPRLTTKSRAITRARR